MSRFSYDKKLILYGSKPWADKTEILDDLENKFHRSRDPSFYSSGNYVLVVR